MKLSPAAQPVLRSSVLAIGARVVCMMKRADGALQPFDGVITEAWRDRVSVRFDGSTDTYVLSASDCVVTQRARR